MLLRQQTSHSVLLNLFVRTLRPAREPRFQLHHRQLTAVVGDFNLNSVALSTAVLPYLCAEGEARSHGTCAARPVPTLRIPPGVPRVRHDDNVHLRRLRGTG